MAQIIAPNKDYTGESASVTFIKGVGETSDAYLIEWFRTHGYTVTEDEATEVQPVASETAETEAEAEAADVAEQVESEPEASEQFEETPEKPKRTRSSRAKAADAE